MAVKQKYHKTTGWKQHIFQFPWVGNLGEFSWVIAAVSPTRLQSRCLSARVAISAEVSTREGCTSKTMRLWVGLSSLQALGWRLPSVSCYVCLSNVAACFLKYSMGASASKTEITILCSLITEVTACYLCHILLVRSSHLAIPQPKRRDYARARISGCKGHRGHLRVCLSHEL